MSAGLHWIKIHDSKLPNVHLQHTPWLCSQPAYGCRILDGPPELSNGHLKLNATIFSESRVLPFFSTSLFPRIQEWSWIDSSYSLRICLLKAAILPRFWRGSNSRPSACEADVITTTPQNPPTFDMWTVTSYATFSVHKQLKKILVLFPHHDAM